MAAKAKAGLSGTIRKEPIKKTTRQGSGRGSRGSQGRKSCRRQGC
jgi:hypothetical protein